MQRDETTNERCADSAWNVEDRTTNADECKCRGLPGESPSRIVCEKELQTKRDTIKRYEQELQSMKQLFDIALKEKQIQSDQLKHERLRKWENFTCSEEINVPLLPLWSIPKREWHAQATSHSRWTRETQPEVPF